MRTNVHHVTRMPSSMNGNPRWLLHTAAGVYRTAVDAACGYSISDGQPPQEADLEFDGAGHVIGYEVQRRGLDEKERGMALALTPEGIEGWKEEFVAWVAAQPTGTRLTSEDVIDAVGLPTGEVGTNANNAVGAMMNGCAKRGLIVKAGRALSKRSTSHGAELTLWVKGTPGDDLLTKVGPVADPGAEGRRGAANAIGQHINAMLAAMPDSHAAHHDRCWQKHPQCALKAVRQVTIALAQDPQ